jgi:hypothetical protein
VQRSIWNKAFKADVAKKFQERDDIYGHSDEGTGRYGQRLNRPMPVLMGTEADKASGARDYRGHIA